jgi:hypothetical protein
MSIYNNEKDPNVTSWENNLRDQIVNISKAGAYDIVSKQVGELKVENKALASCLETVKNILSNWETARNDGRYSSIIEYIEINLKKRNPHNL